MSIEIFMVLTIAKSNFLFEQGDVDIYTNASVPDPESTFQLLDYVQLDSAIMSTSNQRYLWTDCNALGVSEFPTFLVSFSYLPGISLL